jgi:hypothetical protein
MLKDDLTKLAFPLLRDIYGLTGEDIGALDPPSFIDKVQRVHRGMSTEHEFAAIASWLGKCLLLTQLDDVLHSDGVFRAPDFLVVANFEGRRIPFLVEVKSTPDDTLKWSAGYLASLRGFADLVHLPLLVAWKRHGLWVLADSSLFTKKVTAYHLAFNDAMKSSLMSLLFGNVWITFAPEFRLELKMRIHADADLTQELLPEGTYQMQIEDAGLWTEKGKLDSVEGKDLMWLLIAGASEDRFDRKGDLVTQQYRVDPEAMINLSDVLLARLLWNKTEPESIDWLAEIRKGLPKFTADLTELLDRALAVGALHLGIRQMPQVMPQFLKGIST